MFTPKNCIILLTFAFYIWEKCDVAEHVQAQVWLTKQQNC